MNSKIDKFIADTDQPWQREVMAKVRELIHKADPDVVEEFKWGAPCFEHNGQMIWMFAAKNWVHVSFRYGVLLKSGKGVWEEGPDTASKAKRTIKIREGDKLDEALFIKLVKESVELNESGKKFDFDLPKAGSRTFNLPRKYESFLKEHSQYNAYKERPYYQQKGWIEWIESAKQPETITKRKFQMINELRNGQYMPPASER